MIKKAIKKPKKLPLAKQYKVDLLSACKTVYIYIDTPELKVLIPVEEGSFSKKIRQKDNFILVKNDTAMSFFIKETLLIQAHKALNQLNPKTQKGA